MGICFLNDNVYAQSPVPSFYYDFEDIKNGAIPDQSGNNLHGEIVGAVTLEDGGYLDLNGSQVPANLIPTKGFSLLAWVNVEDDGDQAIFNAWSSDGQWLIHPEVRPDKGYYRWLVRGDKPEGTLGEVRAGKPVKGEWHHYAATYDSASGVAILYIDGNK